MLVLLLAIVSAIGRPAEADGETASEEASPSVQIHQIEVGVDGQFKVGRRTPISVTITGSAPDPLRLAVWVPDPDGNPTKQPSEPVSVSGDGPHVLTSVFRTGRMDGVIRVDIESAGGVLATKTVRSATAEEDETVHLFPPDTLETEYWLTLGTGDGYSQAAKKINGQSLSFRSRGSQAVAVLTLPDTAAIPQQPGGLDSVDVLAVNGAPPISEAAGAAIRTWVEQGGHLVLSVSSREQWDQLPFSAWVPIRDVGDSRLRELDGLRGRFPRSEVIEAGAVGALRFSYDAGETLASSLDGPLWVRLPVQFGQVTLLGLDLSRHPLVTWDSLGSLCEHMADYQRDLGAQRRAQRTTQLSRTGVSDLSTQLATAVDQHPQAAVSSSWMPMGLIIAYLLVIGPLDYLIVHRVLRRPHLTWLTFPLLVLATATLAVSSARQNHPVDMVSRQVGLLDIDTDSGAVRTTLWSSFVSPETRRYKVQSEFGNWPHGPDESTTDSSSSAAWLGWTGVPENGFRGMYRSGGLDLAKPRYRFAARLHAIEDVPVSVWSSFGTTAVHFGQVSNPQQIIGSDLEGIGGQLDGTVANRLTVPIEDWFIAYGNLVYFPRQPEQSTDTVPFASGQTISVRQNNMVVRTARSFLTGVTNIRIRKGQGENDQSNAATRDEYDPLSRNFDRILRAISFYRKSGGKEFTTLDNVGLKRLDLSPFLDLSRAVLFGRVAVTPAELLVDGQPIDPDDSETFLRVLLPVRARQ